MRGHLHQHRRRPLERRRVAPDHFAGCIHHSQHWDEILDRVAYLLEPDVPEVGMACRQFDHPRAGSADHDRRSLRPRSTGPQLTVARRVEGPREIDAAVTEQRSNDLHSLCEPARPMVEGEPERVELWLVPTRTDAQDEPAVTDL